MTIPPQICWGGGIGKFETYHYTTLAEIWQKYAIYNPSIYTKMAKILQKKEEEANL